MNKYQEKAVGFLNSAGIAVNGGNPWDMQVLDERVFERVMKKGALGLGESYMDKWWSAEKPDEFFYRLLGAHLEDEVSLTFPLVIQGLKTVLSNRQSHRRGHKNARHHYDIGNDLFERMLGKTMAYSCGYWANAETLDEAQEAKFDLICRKMGLEKGMTILDVGCGWGMFMKYAVDHYGVEVIGLTLSKEQKEWGTEACRWLLIILQDYRKFRSPMFFDRIISIGMVEHVGYRNYRVFMEKMRKLLKPNGLFLLHTIGANKSMFTGDSWMEKYIFPGGQLPSVKQISKAVEGRFIIEDLHNFGSDYDKTLVAWHKNFTAAWPELKDKYGERFYRMWTYYLLSCAGSFRARHNQLWQIMLSPEGVRGGWKSVR